MVSVTSFPQHLLASRVPYHAFRALHATPGGASPRGGTMTTRPEPAAWKNATLMSCRPISQSCSPLAFVFVAAMLTKSLVVMIGGVAWVTSSLP
eukprot:6891778-Pyramimonas_sp.AAC.1